MHRVVKQRNSFNNFNIFKKHLIGGMETDGEWARQQRESDEVWESWRRERDEEWEREREREREREWRKQTYRRERDAMKRGTWEVTEPLTTDEENELRELKNWDLWWEVSDPITMETN